MLISVLLPDCYRRGQPHATIDFTARVVGDKLFIFLTVDGEDYGRVHGHSAELTWEDLNVVSHK